MTIVQFFEGRLDAAWWKRPRRTRNRMMLEARKKHPNSYRSLGGWVLNRLRAWRAQNEAYYMKWKPPVNSYDVPLADESK